jgi:hypothetical protein
MDRHNRSNLVIGLVLVLLGAWFLLDQLVPGLHFWINTQMSWPLIVVAAGVFLLVFGLLVGTPELAVPACIVGGVGGLLYWQNTSGNWESWAYAWTLIPGFVGIGIILSGILRGEVRRGFSAGISAIIVSLVLFVIFSSFLGGKIGLGVYWPALLILLGLWIFIRGLILKR